jgi:hypothetical protein
MNTDRNYYEIAVASEVLTVPDEMRGIEHPSLTSWSPHA